MGCSDYYREDSPKWLFLVTFCAPLLALFLTGYFTLQFQVIEQDDFNKTATELSKKFVMEVDDGAFNASDYDAIYWLMMDYENVLINRTRPHLVGYDKNAYLTANLFFGGAKYNKTGGLGVLVFYLLSYLSLTTFVSIYITSGSLTDNSEEEEDWFPASWQSPYSNNNNNTNYIDAIQEDRMGNVAKYINKYGDIHRAWQAKERSQSGHFKWALAMKETLHYDFWIGVVLVGFVAAPIIFGFLAIIIVVAFPESVHNRNPYHAFVARAFGIDLALELVYTVASWIYFFLISVQSLLFHAVCTSTAFVLFKIFVD